MHAHPQHQTVQRLPGACASEVDGAVPCLRICSMDLQVLLGAGLSQDLMSRVLMLAHVEHQGRTCRACWAPCRGCAWQRGCAGAQAVAHATLDK